MLFHYIKRIANKQSFIVDWTGAKADHAFPAALVTQDGLMV